MIFEKEFHKHKLMTIQFRTTTRRPPSVYNTQDPPLPPPDVPVSILRKTARTQSPTFERQPDPSPPGFLGLETSA